jgi:hypothetical protein
MRFPDGDTYPLPERRNGISAALAAEHVGRDRDDDQDDPSHR